jgi:hypothetical protein
VDEAVEPLAAPIETTPPAPPPPPPGRAAPHLETRTPPVGVPPVAVERPRYSMETQETAFGEIPASRDERETIDLAELVRFRDKMQQTLQSLIEEYSRLLSLGPRR